MPLPLHGESVYPNISIFILITINCINCSVGCLSCLIGYIITSKFKKKKILLCHVLMAKDLLPLICSLIQKACELNFFMVCSQ